MSFLESLREKIPKVLETVPQAMMTNFNALACGSFVDTYILLTLIHLYADETSGLDALQTLADLSLTMLDSAVESGKRLMLSF